MTKYTKIYLVILIVAAVVNIGAIAYFWAVSVKNVKVPIAGNIHDVNFAKLADDIAAGVKADGGAILASHNFYVIRVGPTGNFQNFTLGFGSVRGKYDVSFQGNLFRKEMSYLYLGFSHKTPLTGDEKTKSRYFIQAFGLLDRIPWEHVSANLGTDRYANLMIDMDSSGTTNGEWRVELFKDEPNVKAFLVEPDGTIRQATDNMRLPQTSYMLIAVATELNVGDGYHAYLLQYYFHLYPEF